MRINNRSSPVVVDTNHSPHANLKPVPLTAVALQDGFWAPRLACNRTVTLPIQYQLLEETGRLDNLRRAAGNRTLPFRGRYFNDSDVYKWLEAAAWALVLSGVAGQDQEDPALSGMAGTVVDVIAAAQQPDGYLNSYFMFERAHERWTNLRDMHELYCAGHLIQAAVAHHRATGRPELLAVARRLADHICGRFGPLETSRHPGVPGHEEIEMALVELARETGAGHYREQAAYFIDARGHGLIGGSPYHQDHLPVREAERLAGHAVRALYLNAGAADLYAESGEPALRTALERTWQNLTARQLYVHGGVGPHHAGESFGADYELPNARAYAETCAAIAGLMWNWRMLVLDGGARYADLLEWMLYNGVLPGISLDGRAYFYENPLADGGEHRRQTWFDCACCPPNVARLLASLPGYFYSRSDAGLWIHMYAAGSARIPLGAGGSVTLRQHTDYPWDGTVELEVQATAGSDAAGPFNLYLRVPAWCPEGATLEVNGQSFDGELAPGAYAAVRRAWQAGDALRLALPMPVRPVQAHPYALENEGRVALTRGPLLYCLEGCDNPGFDLRDARLPAGARFTAAFQQGLLGGVVVLRTQAETAPLDAGWAGRLYRPAPAAVFSAPARTVELAAVPYFAWANREPGALQVWLRRET